MADGGSLLASVKEEKCLSVVQLRHTMFGDERTNLNSKRRGRSISGDANTLSKTCIVSSDRDTKSSGGWIVNKFGGTSVGSASAIRKVCDIVIKSLEGCTSRMAVVVSAIGGNPKVTDLLLQAIDLAATSGFEPARDIIDRLCVRHIEYIKELCIPWNEAQTIIEEMKTDIENIDHVLRVVSLFRHQHQVMKDLVSGYGEVWSGKVLCALLNAHGACFSFINARNNILIVDDTPKTGAVVDWEASNDRLRDALSSLGNNTHLVITGFIACTEEGRATTLKRDGSDYSASIFGKLLKAKAINIWTDVDGMMSADPRLVRESRLIEIVSYNEAIELSYFGAKVVHQKAMLPAALAGIPIYIKNTFNPLAPGTCISYSSTATHNRPGCVCGIGLLKDVALINIEGTGMIGVPGISERLFHSLHAMNINVTFVSQASSELNITVGIHSDLAETARACVSKEFSMELRVGLISKVTKIQSCSIITIVGDSMMHKRNVSGRFFSALGNASVNVIAIAQGSNERNVSCVVDEKDSTIAVQAVHAALIVPGPNCFNIGVYGVDSPVGDVLMKILSVRVSEWNLQYKTKFRVHPLVDARVDGECISDDKQLELKIQLKKENLINEVERKEQDRHCYANGETGENNLESKRQQQPTTEMNYHQLLYSTHGVIVDCTTGEDVPGQTSRLHRTYLNAEMNVISNNADAASGVLRIYNSALFNLHTIQNLQSRRRAGILYSSAQYLYQSIFPVHIPILSTLKDLQVMGNTISRVEFSFSPLLNHVMSLVSPLNENSSQKLTLMEAAHFAVKVQRWTYSNNNPQNDIRKWLLVLGWCIGLNLIDNNVKVESPIHLCVYEKAMQEANVESYHQSSDQDRNESLNSKEGNLCETDVDAAILAADQRMSRLVEAAQANGKVLRHVAVIDVPSCSSWANLCEVDLCDDFSSVDGSTCCARIHVEENETPVVLKGPKTTTEDTAYAILREIINLAGESDSFQEYD